MTYLVSSFEREMSKRLCFRIQTFSFGFCGVLDLFVHFIVTKEVRERERERELLVKMSCRLVLRGKNISWITNVFHIASSIKLDG